ncbi:MAG: hypothetical protein ACRDK9_01620 [Solirubrobacterales bacterium]
MRRRRTYLIGALGLALALAISSVAISAPADQTLDVIVGGKAKPKLDKKQFKKSSIEVTTTVADAANPSGIPPKANRAVLKFSKPNLKFSPRAKPGCEPSQVENTTTEAALAACGNAKVSRRGDATVALPLGPGGSRQDFPAVVTAFNDGSQKGILLHTRVPDLGTTAVLRGKITGGNTLDVAIPPIGGGAGAVDRFHVLVKAGKYVQARCKRKTIKTKSTFSFNDAPDATVADSQKCKRKKKRN